MSAARKARAASVIVAVLAATSCGGSTKAPAIPAVFDLDHDPTIGISATGAGDAVIVPAADLRLLLESQLGWHGITLVEAMRGAAEGDIGTQVWIDALAANTDDVVGSIGLVYGATGAGAFHQQWAQHTQFLVDYAVAVANGDDGAAATARLALVDYANDAGSFLSTATDGALPVETARAVLATHVETMMHQLDEFVAGRSARSTELALEDHEYLFGIADALAGAIATQYPLAFPGPVDTPDARFCSLAQLRAGAAVIATVGGGGETSAPYGPDDPAALIAAHAALAAAVANGDAAEIERTSAALLRVSAELAVEAAAK